MMALSLAACGGSSTPVAVVPEVADPVVPVVETPAGESFVLTSVAAGDQFSLTAQDDTVTGTGATLNTADIVLDVTTTDADVMNIAITGDISDTPVVTNIETVNITHSGFTAGSSAPTVLDIDVANFTGATAFNVAVDATTSVIETAISNLATGQSVSATTSTIDLDAIDDNAAITVDSSAASATATSTVEVTSAGALTALTVTEATGHLDLDVTTGDLDGSLTVDAAQDADVAADAATSAVVTAGRDVTITSLVAAKTVAITAGRDVADAADDLLDAATSVTITAGRQINGVDMDAATTATLSAAGVDASASGGANKSSTITGDALTTLNVSGNGGALEMNIAGANADGLKTINVSGDQSVTLTTDASLLDSVTGFDVNDTTTAGTTTLVLGGSAVNGAVDLSKVDTSVKLAMTVSGSSDIITVASGADVTFDANQTAATFTAAAATASSNVLNLSVDKSGTAATTHTVSTLTTTNIKTVNVDLTADAVATTFDAWGVGAANNLNVTYGTKALSALDGDAEITAGTATFIGSGALTLGDEMTVSAIDATGVSGAVTVTADAGDVIQTGSGKDVTTAGDINVNIQTNGGNDTHNLSGDLTTAGTNTSYVLNMGEGTGDTLNVADSSNTNSSAVQLSGFEKIVLAGDATMRDTQLDGVAAAVSGASNSVLTIGVSQAVNDFSGLTVNVLNMTTADNDGFVMDASAFTSAVTITGTGFDDTITASANASAVSDTIVGGAGDDTISVTEGGDSVTGGDGTDTISFEEIDGAFTDVEGGTSDATGMVINMGTTAVTAVTVANNSASYMSGSDSSLAAGEFGYLFATDATTNSAVVGTVATVENVIGSTGGDYIVGSSAANTITGGTGSDYIDFGGADTKADVAVFGAFATNGNDTIVNFETTVDHLNLDASMTGVTDVVAVTGIAAEGTEANFIDNEVYVFADGASATDSGTATDVITTYTDLDEVAAFVSDVLTVGDDTGSNDTVDGDEAIFVINDLVGDVTYVYHFEESGTGIDSSAGDVVQAGELTLISVVTEAAGSALVAGDIV